jgi:hypothetical protein
VRNTLSTALLVLALCCPVSAGLIHNPPPQSATLLSGTVHTTADAETAAPCVSDGLTEITLDLLAFLPALF